MANIRITGGQWRSRLVKVVDQKKGIPGLRPTPDRVRVTLFNWLGQNLDGLRCLDLFSGSGMLGFEAASRGASHVTLVEQSPEVFRQLQHNAHTLTAATTPQGLELIRTDALKFMTTVTQPYDLLFLDPPYHQDWLERIAPYLTRVLTQDARIYVEAEHAVSSLGDWQCVKQNQAGQVFYQLLERPCPIEPLFTPALSTL